MIKGLISTPRPMPGRKGPAIAGTLAIILALPIFVAAGWPLTGWAIAAAVWGAGEVLAFSLGRLPLGLDHLATSGIMAIAMSFRVIGVMLVLIVITVADKPVGVAATVTYIAAYTLELMVSLASYFGSER
jgi:hypothetical protein